MEDDGTVREQTTEKGGAAFEHAGVGIPLEGNTASSGFATGKPWLGTSGDSYQML